MSWEKQNIKYLRLRLGWSQSDLARRLQCSPQFIETWELGDGTPDEVFTHKLDLLSSQAEACADQVQNSPRAEVLLEEVSIDQVSNHDLLQGFAKK